jgi:alpha-glucosidase
MPTTDGIGDIPGIIHKLDYIASLGVNALWINPCYVSPFDDAGYDVADYTQVAPRYGTNDDLARLIAEAKLRGIRILLDLVPGHTSIEHPWFKASQNTNPTPIRITMCGTAQFGRYLNPTCRSCAASHSGTRRM